MRIEDNPHLFLCEVQSVCNYLASGDTVTISNNAPGCNSAAEIEAACMVPVEETSGSEAIIHFSPNPSSDVLHIQINDSKIWDLSFHDLQGRQKFRQRVSGSQMIWVRDWPSGVYELRAVSDERVFSLKIVKQ
jgi:hypothetical protein